MGWVTISTFLIISIWYYKFYQGCAVGKHSNVKPEPVQPVTSVKDDQREKSGENSSNVTTFWCYQA